MWNQNFYSASNKDHKDGNFSYPRCLTPFSVNDTKTSWYPHPNKLRQWMKNDNWWWIACGTGILNGNLCWMKLSLNGFMFNGRKGYFRVKNSYFFGVDSIQLKNELSLFWLIYFSRKKASDMMVSWFLYIFLGTSEVLRLQVRDGRKKWIPCDFYLWNFVGLEPKFLKTSCSFKCRLYRLVFTSPKACQKPVFKT